LGCDRLETMVRKEVARFDGPGVKRVTHDRKASADVGFRVWNPFEAELRVDVGGWHDQVAKSFSRVRMHLKDNRQER
jgi:hypothetical protein